MGAERPLSRLRAPVVRRALNVGLLLFGVAVTALAGKQVAGMGWPFSHADAGLAAAAGVLFLAGYGVKAHGWKLLFAPHERPGAASLCAAGGAACLTGIALPGRFDDVVRIAVVRRLRGCPAGIKALMLSLVTLGLIDTVALTPLASSAAALATVPTYLRIGLAVVAGAGIAAAVVVVVLPRVVGHRRLIRFRLSGFLGEHSPSTRAAARALAFVLASWVIRRPSRSCSCSAPSASGSTSRPRCSSSPPARPPRRCRSRPPGRPTQAGAVRACSSSPV